jgi:sec-independent protein translocase protein TatC
MALTDTNTPAPPTEPAEHAPGDREMTMLEHLNELRHRLVVSVLAVVVGLLVSIIPIPGFDSLAHFTMYSLVQRAPASADGVHLVQVLGPGEGIFTFLEVALMIGVAVAMPVIIYQLLAFVAPALYDNEKKYLWIAVPGVSISFAIGVLFCYFLMLPFAIAFLGGFQTDIFLQQWSAERYLDFVVTFMFWVGVVFELPIVMYFLTKLGVVTPQRLASFRKYAFVLAFVIGAVITPTPDPINQTIVSLPIYFLYELGIILARFA